MTNRSRRPQQARRAWGPPLLLMAAVLSLYLAFRSVSLDDFDSYSFVLAVRDFNLTLQQPQPPGFPVYVASARLLQRLLKDETLALTTLSALSGAGSALVIYALGRWLDRCHRTTATIGALLFALTPVSWLSAEKALSDAAGVLWTLLALGTWLHWHTRSPRQPGVALPIAAGMISGLALGVRPQNTMPLLLFVTGLFIDDIIHRRNLAPWGVAGMAGVTGILLWLIPVARSTGGLGAYLTLIRAHGAHVGRADSLLGAGTRLIPALRRRAIAFSDTLLMSLLGVGVHQRSDPQRIWRAVALACAGLPGLFAADWRRRETQWLGLWALMAGAQIYIFEALDRPRLFLPLVPPLALLVGSGWAQIRRPRNLRAGFLALSFLWLLLQTLPWAVALSQSAAPPTQATAYISVTYPTGETLVAAAGSYRAAQVELPEYPLVYLYQFNPDIVRDAVAGSRSYIAILDRDQFTPQAIAALSNDGAWITIDDRTFARDPRIHSQHDKVRLQVLAPPDSVPSAALDLPADGCIDLGAESDARYLGLGWFRPEEIGGITGRWAGQVPTTTLRFNLSHGNSYLLRFRALAYPPAQSVTLHLDGRSLGEVPLSQAWMEFEIRSSLEQTSGPTGPSTMVTLELTHERLSSPLEATGGASSDRRALAAAYDWLCVVPLNAVGE
ncbi:MAG: ArnT family glycosyltransferase [Anaerolineae bacterium]